jgi:hypothetical protein
MSTEARTAFQIRNWANDHEALVHRGDITLWLTDAILAMETRQGRSGATVHVQRPRHPQRY